MATLHVRDIPDEVIDAIRRQAEAHGRSMSAEIRHLLVTSVERQRPLHEIAASVAEVRARYSAKRIDVDGLLREGRDAR